jgi:hypothetical protein
MAPAMQLDARFGAGLCVIWESNGNYVLHPMRLHKRSNAMVKDG